jgi:hypothetical protein
LNALSYGLVKETALALEELDRDPDVQGHESSPAGKRFSPPAPTSRRWPTPGPSTSASRAASPTATASTKSPSR